MRHLLLVTLLRSILRHLGNATAIIGHLIGTQDLHLGWNVSRSGMRSACFPHGDWLGDICLCDPMYAA